MYVALVFPITFPGFPQEVPYISFNTPASFLNIRLSHYFALDHLTINYGYA
jgi:hypothetical protein